MKQVTRSELHDVYDHTMRAEVDLLSCMDRDVRPTKNCLKSLISAQKKLLAIMKKMGMSLPFDEIK